MLFHLKADVIFEAKDLEDAQEQLAFYFEFEGTLRKLPGAIIELTSYNRVIEHMPEER